MKLLRIEIENFGKLSRYSLDLRDGLNVLCEKNGWGKTTLAVFIKAMLYGLPAVTKKSLDKNERKKYIPWQGGAYGGSIELESDKGSFRIERFFGAKEADDEFRLFDLSTNKPSDVYSSEIGIELFGIDADGFARSTYLAQSGLERADSESEKEREKETVSITAKLTGLLEDVNDIGCYDIAIEAIDKRRKFYEVKGGRGRVSDLSAELTQQKNALDECRRAIPAEEEQKQALAQKNEQIAITDGELRRVRDDRLLSERQQAHRQARERLERTVEQLETERGEVLDAFRDRRIPTDAELSAARKLLTEYRQGQVALQSYRLSEEEAQTLEVLSERYPKGAPDKAALDGIREALQAVSEAKARVQAVQEIPDTREQLRFRKTGIPPQQQLDSATEQLEQAEKLGRRLEEEAQTPLPPPKRKIPLGISIAAIAVGAIIAVIGFAVEGLRVPFLILGAVAIAIGIPTLILGGKRTDASAEAERNKRLEQLKNERDGLLHAVEECLQRYAALPENGDYRSALGNLSLLARRAQDDQRRQAKQAEQIKTLTEAYNTSRRLLNTRFTDIGFAAVPPHPQAVLMQIHSDTRELSRLLQKERQTTHLRTDAEAVLREQQSRLSDFINRLTEKASKQPEDCLAQAERLCQKHAHLLGNIKQQKLALRELDDRASEELSKQLPGTEALKAEEETLERRLLVLNEEKAEILRRLERISEQTQKIPDLEDQVAYLSAELETARENLELLRHTSAFLADAKQALSTRYLEGMQASFSHYRALVEGSETSDASIDVSFDITVRDGGKSRELKSYSRGSRDILQFCARLALTRSMFSEGERPFLLLDDPFVNLDEDHLSAARELLDRLASEFQILYFVCHPDRA